MSWLSHKILGDTALDVILSHCYVGWHRLLDNICSCFFSDSNHVFVTHHVVVKFIGVKMVIIKEVKIHVEQLSEKEHE